MSRYKRGTGTNKWFNPEFRRSIIPILDRKRNGVDNIVGTGFLLSYYYEGYPIIWLVTAYHVIEGKNPILLLRTKCENRVRLDLEIFDDIDWIVDEDMDLAIFPLMIDGIALSNIDIYPVRPDMINTNFPEKDSNVIHLGYPEKKSDHNMKAIGMLGTFSQYLTEENLYETNTAGYFTASGGPLFSVSNGWHSLIGVVIKHDFEIIFNPLTESKEIGDPKDLTYSRPISDLIELLNCIESREMTNRIYSPQVE